MSNCELFSTLITKHLDGNISDCERNQLMNHVSCCKSCKDEYEKYNSILYVLNEKTEIEPPETFESDVMKKIQIANLNEKKSKEKSLLKLYFVASMMFTIMLTLASVAFKEQFLNIMLYTNLPSQYAYGIYEFLEVLEVFFNVVQGVFIYLNVYLSDMYFMLIGLATLVFVSKAYQPKNKKSCKNKCVEN
ncbi:hypothetical protein RBH29_09605 [Herbivorax sp. ANBcel31]|uniref:anti-sigma factor family protein n=1 Tax=Herbivorax sp. ANBcel31 TaxID=3069754 RepID=UPI0027B5C7B8|nr:hypothetical protein [Herbivorax sp. ANBcel31]MDQ2086679.1 hypothetical protein [Herbivorax sp. ANBcel31]